MQSIQPKEVNLTIWSTGDGNAEVPNTLLPGRLISDKPNKFSGIPKLKGPKLVFPRPSQKQRNFFLARMLTMKM
jgi:hypothetical protein